MYYFQVQQVWLSSLSTEELRSCFPFRCKSVFFINLSKFKYLNFRSRILCRLLLPPIPADNLQSWPWLPAPPHAAAKEGKTKEKEEVVQYFLSQTKRLPKNEAHVPKNANSHEFLNNSLSCEVLL